MGIFAESQIEVKRLTLKIEEYRNAAAAVEKMNAEINDLNGDSNGHTDGNENGHDENHSETNGHANGDDASSDLSENLGEFTLKCLRVHFNKKK